MIPQNPLDAFQSHSVHFILLASNNTEAIRMLINPMDNADDSKPKSFLSQVTKVALGEEIGDNTGCYLILDSRRTSEFSIDSLNYDVRIAGGDAPNTSVSLATGMSMRIIDPSGVGFFNYLKYLIDQKFQCDSTGITFLLHTMFIGHRDDDSKKDTIVHSSYMPMIMGGSFNLSSFDTKGGVYDITFMPMDIGGIVNCDAYNQLHYGTHFSATDGLLGNAIQSFENVLNRRNVDWFLHYNPDRKVDTNGKPIVKSTSKDAKSQNGRIVQYMFTIPKSWFYFKVDTSKNNNAEFNFKEYHDKKRAAVNEAEQKAQAEQEKNNLEALKAGKAIDTKTYDSKHSTAVNMSIEEGLMSIINSCDDVKALGNATAKNDGAVKVYKILTSITSNTETILVHYDIVEYELPNTAIQKKIIETSRKGNGRSNHPSTHPSGQYDRNGIESENTMEFDYIFSGKNSDVLDMKIQVNNLFLGLLSKPVVGPIARKQRTESDQKKNDDEDSPITSDPYGVVSRFQPMIPPPKSAEAVANFSKLHSYSPDEDIQKKMADSQEFHKVLNDLCVPGSQVDLKIRGNPDIIKRYSVGSVFKHLILSGTVKQYLIDAASDASFNKSASWEYNATSKSTPKSAGKNTITQSHVIHREEIDKLVETTLNETNQLIDDSNSDEKRAKNFLSQATWALVNIYGPSDYSFSNATDSVKPSDDKYNNFKTKLFYDSWYLVSHVGVSFEHGNFTQTLSLLMVDMYDDPLQPYDPNAAKDQEAKNTSQVTDSTPPVTSPRVVAPTKTPSGGIIGTALTGQSQSLPVNPTSFMPAITPNSPFLSNTRIPTLANLVKK